MHFCAMNQKLTFITGIFFLLIIFLKVGLTGRGVLWTIFILFILSVLALRAVIGEISKRQELYFLFSLFILLISALIAINFNY